MTNIIKLAFEIAGRKVAFDMRVDADSATDRELLTALRYGIPEPEVSHLMARVLRPGDSAIDGGANIGFFTLLMSKLVGEEGYIFSFEPGQNNFFKLEENVFMNKSSTAKHSPILMRAPLWNKKEALQLHMCLDGSKNSLAPHADTRGSEIIEATTLNNWAKDHPYQLIKLDIEGAEEKALCGGTSLLQGDDACPYIVVELNAEALPKFNSSAESVCDFLWDYGYRPFILHASGIMPTCIPRRVKVTPNRLNWNVLFSTLDNVAAAWPEITL